LREGNSSRLGRHRCTLLREWGKDRLRLKWCALLRLGYCWLRRCNGSRQWCYCQGLLWDLDRCWHVDVDGGGHRYWGRHRHRHFDHLDRGLWLCGRCREGYRLRDWDCGGLRWGGCTLLRLFCIWLLRCGCGRLWLSWASRSQLSNAAVRAGCGWWGVLADCVR
jgi:hypothetical protein